MPRSEAKNRQREGTLAARDRSIFHREYDLVMGQVIATPSGEFGEFQGISTRGSPHELIVKLYQTKSPRNNDYMALPTKFQGSRGPLRLVYENVPRPHVPEPRRGH